MVVGSGEQDAYKLLRFLPKGGDLYHYYHSTTNFKPKGLPKNSAKSLPWVENLNNLFTVYGGKFVFSAQGSDLALFVGNGSKSKIPFEIKLALTNPNPSDWLKNNENSGFRVLELVVGSDEQDIRGHSITTWTRWGEEGVKKMSVFVYV